jgi:hypothetical protein
VNRLNFHDLTRFVNVGQAYIPGGLKQCFFGFFPLTFGLDGNGHSVKDVVT